MTAVPTQKAARQTTATSTATKTDLALPLIFGRVREIVDAARAHVARTVNSAQVMSNWLIGREMVEDEQQGKRRADYGKQLVAQLSEQLTTAYGKGWSAPEQRHKFDMG